MSAVATTWPQFVAALTPAQRDGMLHSILVRQIDELGRDGDVGFRRGDDASLADIYWTACGGSIVPPADPSPPLVISVEPQQALAKVEQAVIESLMQATAGDKPAVAKICGISLRTLYTKLEQYANRRLLQSQLVEERQSDAAN